MSVNKLQIYQEQFYNSDECSTAISEMENKYKYVDETEYFSKLVNFSTAKNVPYQRWVRYREGYSTVLVEELLRRANISRDTHFVADPMVGSGTTVLAAKQKGYDVFGVDINPFCKVIADAKLLQPNFDTIKEIESFLKEILTIKPWEDDIDLPLMDYFPEDNLRMLIALKKHIYKVDNTNVRNILLACWYFIIENCSNRKKDGNGLATRPSPVKNVLNYFADTMQDILNDYTEQPLCSETKSLVYTGTACEFASFSQLFAKQTDGKKLGAVIFSPPYANSFDYFESYKMELLFGELLSIEDYKSHKKKQIRNYRICYGKELHSEFHIVELICQEIRSEIPKKEERTGKRDGRTRLMPNMLCGYFTDMRAVLKELYDALDTGGACYIVVDQSAYVGVIVPTDVILANLGEEVGFNVDEIVICRKANTSAQQLKAYPYLANTLRESIVCLKKV
jgi:site-specific DNA-methyltransferase (adenine-specific)